MDGELVDTCQSNADSVFARLGVFAPPLITTRSLLYYVQSAPRFVTTFSINQFKNDSVVNENSG